MLPERLSFAYSFPVNTPAILCHQLHKTYLSRGSRVAAVNGLDLVIQSGECFGLLGPNGAGKTTTIEILEGLLDASSGDIQVLGRRWNHHAAELRQRIGISLQETLFSDKLRVIETVQLFRSFYRQGPSAEEVIAEVGLTEKSQALIESLSGGQKQRLAVASALVGDPELLFLDEPTTGLDPQSRLQLWDTIRCLRRRGKTILLTTHYMDEAEKLCDRVAIVDYGRVITLGSPKELIASIGGDHVVEFELSTGPDPVLVESVLSCNTIPKCSSSRLDGNVVLLTTAEPHLAIPELLHRLRQQELSLTRLTTRHAGLEDVFVKLTGRHLRDDPIRSN